MPIFKKYGNSFFGDCKRASEETVETLKLKLFEKLEQFLFNLHFESKDLKDALADDEFPNQGKANVSAFAAAHEASIREFTEALCAYRVIFLRSEHNYLNLHRTLLRRNSKPLIYILRSSSALQIFWRSFAALIDVKDFITSAVSHLLLDISDTFSKIQSIQKERTEEVYPLKVTFEARKKAVIQGSMDVLLDFHRLLTENSELLLELRGYAMDWVQEAFQDFFRKVHDYFLLLCGRVSLPVKIEIR
ncbi:vacuolar protein sorting-associated protein 51 homolog [Olea europaea var. sylvestris]|uniref:vacuolar protein sorting-associated protein 51 homolog n=1 Tax=Olea europaea var. sylvestris TaxID=158386 RepID=UPI000C1CD918|nr:vacuolar protein sorting-associated protein 51 homolog [Olea europaea var. sylvestris]XP_022847223.1 vacuolar protein sorting-associated protein 51 homolog [Olea europaea var. sylvestris]XP_022847224.1 vacuolar protein sorting-associated protein 51 homolog [Olea europaea var. sylvestris]XP_022847225.1 vacuolar protein sorting-associated protein 51 homolog [Olea europaea var. sylvestris]XP_022847226.1 vacuolar protein sorting-associated protein 51 homolog [Olea europaea var. sylvestris]XP_02